MDTFRTKLEHIFEMLIPFYQDVMKVTNRRSELRKQQNEIIK